MTVATLRIRGLLGVVTIALAGCTAVNQTTRPAELVGTVSLPDGADLHQKTVVVISLVDLDRMDVVNQVVEETPVQHPIPFAVEYDRNEIVSSHQYGVEAVVIERGRPRYKNEPLDRVLTQGNPDKVDIVVEPLN
jgi:putative lipoprotein